MDNVIKSAILGAGAFATVMVIQGLYIKHKNKQDEEIENEDA